MYAGRAAGKLSCRVLTVGRNETPDTRLVVGGAGEIILPHCWPEGIVLRSRLHRPEYVRALTSGHHGRPCLTLRVLAFLDLCDTVWIEAFPRIDP